MTSATKKFNYQQLDNNNICKQSAMPTKRQSNNPKDQPIWQTGRKQHHSLTKSSRHPSASGFNRAQEAEHTKPANMQHIVSN